MTLNEFLLKKKYHQIKLNKNAIGHYQLKVCLNNVEGNFILDTGASSTCIGVEYVEKYKLNPEDSEIKAAGAGAIDMETFESNIESLHIGDLKTNQNKIIIFDLTQINSALIQHDAEEISGIIGADILEDYSAVISYEDESLFLKEVIEEMD